MSRFIDKIAALMLSLMIAASFTPAQAALAADSFGPDTVTSAETAAHEASEELSDGAGVLLAASAAGRGISADTEITGGTITMNGTLGTAVPDTGYDLATVRQLWTDGSGAAREEYLDYKYNKTSGAYTFAAADVPGSVVTAFFYDLNRWDGAVDVTWYDPDKTEFEISTPAQLAGLAAIANGMVDENVTHEYMIRDNAGRTCADGVYSHRYISTEPALADLLTPNNSGGAGQVRDTAWRLPAVEHKKVGGAADDIHNDFLYRTVRITADLDMGDCNWTPIGGKYAMNRDATDGREAKVIDTRFQGVLDGQGHTVTITCDRQAKLGFAYAMEIALVGYLGGGVDYKNGYPKDTYMDYEQKWVPTVRNVVVRGSVKGRRMVGGVVGRTGETNYGVLVENCANYAAVEASDMRGCAGIVGAAWGKATIRNCYNAGAINSNYWEHGGIIGSNGYEGSEGREPGGADIYNCYNSGTITMKGSYDGQEIGVDGGAFASYMVSNCYYEQPSGGLKQNSGYSGGETAVNKRARISSVEAVDLKSDDTLAKLNMNGRVFAKDTAGINNGYPILYFQTDEYRTSPDSFRTASVTLVSSDASRGTISSEDNLRSVPYGTNINITTTAKKGYRFSHFEVTDSTGVSNVTSGGFVTVTGRDLTVKGVFTERAPSVIAFAEAKDGEDYYVTVTKVYDAMTGKECSQAVSDGAKLSYGDRISIKPVMKPLDTVHPDIKYLEYTGTFGDPVITENALDKVSNTNNVYEVTGETDVIEISFKPKTQGKRWTTVADTSWYEEGKKEFTIMTARQLAGAAILCEKGVSFEGVTLLLGSDISLENTKANSGDEYGYERSWTGIGESERRPFKGTFDGQGHTVRYMHRNFAPGYCFGGNGGLFGVIDGAVIKNVAVEGGSYVNDDGATMDCEFKNGANGGGIAGDAIDTLIENCSADLRLSGASVAGGIVGTAEGSTVIRNCVSTCAIDATGEAIGGIAGKFISEDGKAPLIEACRNEGNITSTKWKVGGILGDGNSAGRISKCENHGNIETEMKSTSANTQAAGGVIGYAGGEIICTECFNTGDVTGRGKSYALGGIAGTVIRGTIENCYNTGKVYSESTATGAQLAGIANVGTNRSFSATVRNCYNIGAVQTGSGFTSKSVGGVIGAGSTEKNIITNSYCSDASVKSIGKTAGIAGTVVSSDKLKGYQQKLGAAFISDRKGINGGYPVLEWQDPDHMADAYITKITPVGDTALTVNWAVSGTCDGFEVARSENLGGKYTPFYNGTATSTRSSGLTYGKTYYFRVRAYKMNDEAKEYGEWSEPVSYSLVPAATTITAAKNTKAKTVVLKWKKVSEITGYEVYRSTKKSSSFKKIATVKGASKIKYTDKTVKKGKTYYYKIRVYKTTLGSTGYSTYSAVKSVKVSK